MRLCHLSLLLILGLVGICATQAARAPEPQPWSRGWKEVDPSKRATFERKGDVLTITVTAPKDENAAHNFTTAPRLLREVSGDFVVEVRIGGSFTPGKGPKERKLFPTFLAGFVLEGEKHPLVRVSRGSIRLPRSGEIATLVAIESLDEDAKGLLGEDIDTHGWPPDRAMYLRMSRTGKELVAAFSSDGKKWQELKGLNQSLPAKLKLGIFAASSSTKPFKAKLDRFKLTPKGPKGPQTDRGSPRPEHLRPHGAFIWEKSAKPAPDAESLGMNLSL
jgi:hypothetical protein